MAETPSPSLSITEAALRSLEQITDPFYTVDSAWRILYANPPAEAAFGRRLDEIAGKVLWEAFPSARDPLFADRLRQVAQERRGQTFEALSPTLKRWIEVRCLPSALCVVAPPEGPRVSADSGGSRL